MCAISVPWCLTISRFDCLCMWLWYVRWHGYCEISNHHHHTHTSPLDVAHTQMGIQTYIYMHMALYVCAYIRIQIFARTSRYTAQQYSRQTLECPDTVSPDIMEPVCPAITERYSGHGNVLFRTYEYTNCDILHIHIHASCTSTLQHNGSEYIHVNLQGSKFRYVVNLTSWYIQQPLYNVLFSPNFERTSRHVLNFTCSLYVNKRDHDTVKLYISRQWSGSKRKSLFLHKQKSTIDICFHLSHVPDTGQRPCMWAHFWSHLWNTANGAMSHYLV